MARCIGLALAVCLVALPAVAEEITGTVTHVRDGNTIVLDGTAIRLLGVAAPATDEPGGREARAYMVELVQHQEVSCDLARERRNGGLIGVCRLVEKATVGGGDLGAMIISMGLARDCPRFSGGRYLDLEMEGSRARPFPAYCID